METTPVPGPWQLMVRREAKLTYGCLILLVVFKVFVFDFLVASQATVPKMAATSYHRDVSDKAEVPVPVSSMSPTRHYGTSDEPSHEGHGYETVTDSGYGDGITDVSHDDDILADGGHGDGILAAGSHGEGVPTDRRHGDGVPTAGSLGEGVPTDGGHGDGVPTAGSHGEGVPTDRRHGDGVPTTVSHGEDVPTGRRHGDGVPTDGRHGDGVPTAGSHGEGVPTDGRHGEGVPTDGRHGEGVPTAGSHGDGVPTDGRHGDGVPTDGRHGDENSTDDRSSDKFQSEFPPYPYRFAPGVTTFRMYRAVATRTNRDQDWNKYMIMGQVVHELDKKRMKCCFGQWNSDIVTISVYLSGSTGHENKKYRDKYYICPYDNNTRPVGLAIAPAWKPCPGDNTTYLAPYFPSDVKPGGLAVCLKVAFGTLSPELVIEWMEAQRSLGVDKVVSLVELSLSPATTRVLQYYSRIGFLDYIPYNHSEYDPVSGNRTYHGGGLKTMTVDFGERYRGYKYMAVYDFDEFIIPSRDRTLKQLIEDLFKAKPDASGFRFKTTFHMNSWEKTGSSDLIIGQYLTATKTPVFNAHKYIALSERIQYGGVTTHYYEHSPEHPRYDVSKNDAVIHHFRACRKPNPKSSQKINALNDEICHNKSLQAIDRQTERFARRLQDRVHTVRKTVFGSTEEPTIFT